MDEILTICTRYGIPDHILRPVFYEYSAALGIEDCFDGMSPEAEQHLGTIIAVELCHADRDDIAERLRQHALQEPDERVARALAVAAET